MGLLLGTVGTLIGLLGSSGMSIDEEDEEIPDWEIEEEKIPPSLEKRWQEEEKKGLRAGVCRCGYPFTKDELSCAHCGASVEMAEGVFASLKRTLLHTPLGILLLILILFAMITYLVSVFF